MTNILYRGLGLCAAVLMLGGCATVPEAISTTPGGPDVREASANPAAHAGKTVRWGGTISEVTNLPDRTVITVVARPLSRRGEPDGGARARGRFLAEVDRFLEPEEYQPGRRLTVVGRFTGTRQERIDQYVYDYPVVRAGHLYLWEEYVRRADPFPWHCPPPWYYPYSWRERHLGYPYHPWCW